MMTLPIKLLRTDLLKVLWTEETSSNATGSKQGKTCSLNGVRNSRVSLSNVAGVSDTTSLNVEVVSALFWSAMELLCCRFKAWFGKDCLCCILSLVGKTLVRTLLSSEMISIRGHKVVHLLHNTF